MECDRIGRVTKPGVTSPLGVGRAYPYAQNRRGTFRHAASARVRGPLWAGACPWTCWRDISVLQRAGPSCICTGIAGDFDTSLEWAPSPEAVSDCVSIFTAVQEQLGLEAREHFGFSGRPSHRPLGATIGQLTGITCGPTSGGHHAAARQESTGALSSFLIVSAAQIRSAR